MVKPGDIPLHPAGGGGSGGSSGGSSGRGGGAGSGASTSGPQWPMWDLRGGPFDLRGKGRVILNAGATAILKYQWETVYTKNIVGAKGGFIICNVVSNINLTTGTATLQTSDWGMYYAELQIFGMLSGTKSILMRGATGQNNSGNSFTPFLTDDSFAGPVVYRWDANDGEVWDEIGVEAREMTMGCPAQPTFTPPPFATRTDLLTLDLNVIGRAW